MTENLSDSMLRLHDRLVDTLMELMSEGDEEVTADDIESTKDIVDIIVDALEMEVVAVEGDYLMVKVTVPTA